MSCDVLHCEQDSWEECSECHPHTGLCKIHAAANGHKCRKSKEFPPQSTAVAATQSTAHTLIRPPTPLPAPQSAKQPKAATKRKADEACEDTAEPCKTCPNKSNQFHKCTQFCHESQRVKEKDGQAISRLDDDRRYASSKSAAENAADVEKNQRFAVPFLKQVSADLQKLGIYDAVCVLTMKRADAGTLAPHLASKLAWYWKYFLPSALSSQQKRDQIVADLNCILCGQTFTNYSREGKLFAGINTTLEKHIVEGLKHRDAASKLKQHMEKTSKPTTICDQEPVALRKPATTAQATRQGTLVLQKSATIPIWNATLKRAADERVSCVL